MRAILEEKFQDCKFQDVKDCTGSYVNSSESVFYVYDPPNELQEPVVVDAVREQHQLTVYNANEKVDICVVRLDKCLFRDNDLKCDCLLFDEQKLFFVEIKNSSQGTKKDKRNRAIQQLGATIDRLRNEGIDIGGYEISAIICFNSLEERTRPIQASFQFRQEQFRNTYGVFLDECNVIRF